MSNHTLIKTIRWATTHPYKYSRILDGIYILTLADGKNTKVEVARPSFISDGHKITFCGTQTFQSGFQSDVTFELDINNSVSSKY